MPKSRKVVKEAGVIKRLNVPHKFKIGTRKNGVAAHTMTTEKLQELLGREDQKRYRHKILAVLELRGVEV